MERKRKLTFIIVVLTAFLTSITIKADNSICYSISLQMENIDGDIKEDISNKGHRVPARPINCVINRNGVFINASIDKENIISYELWTISEVCVGSFIEESDFIQYLYNEELGTDLMIKIVLPDYALVGNL